MAEAAYLAFHQWYVLVVFIVIGGLVGGLIAAVLPPHYRAQAHLYVALNPYRTYSDSVFLALANPKYSNIDNYKYWQLSQLETVIQLDGFLQETLEHLQAEDPYWTGVSLAGLRTMLSAEWRSAGRWDLVAEGQSPERLEQAAAAWQAVSLERVQAAIRSAQQAILTDQELQAGADVLVAAQTRLHDLQAARSRLADWTAALAESPAGEPLPEFARWQGLGLVSGLAEFSPGWQDLLAAQPPEAALPEAYRTWGDRADAFLAGEIRGLEARLETLAAGRERLGETYREQFDASLGLSPAIEIEALDRTPARPVRAPELLILVGALCGGLAWLLLQTVRLTRREARR